MYQMMTVGVFEFLNGVLYIDNGYLVIVNVACLSFSQ